MLGFIVKKLQINGTGVSKILWILKKYDFTGPQVTPTC